MTVLQMITFLIACIIVSELYYLLCKRHVDLSKKRKMTAERLQEALKKLKTKELQIMGMGTEQFGYRFQDEITGYEGICTGTAQYITGCNKLLLEGQATEEGRKDGESIWLDESRLIQISEKPAVNVSRMTNQLPPEVP